MPPRRGRGGTHPAPGAPLTSAATAPPALEPRRRRLAVALLAAGITTFAELYAVQGVLPELSRSIGVSSADAALTVAAGTAGLAAGVFAWTWLADRIGRLPSMRLAVLGAVALSAASCLAPSFSVLLMLRGCTGLLLGAVPVLAVAYVHESLSGRQAAAAATAYISGTTIGGAAGRLIAGPLAPSLGWQGALLVVSGLSLVAAIVFVLLAPAPLHPVRSREPQLARIRAALTKPALLRLYVQAFLLTGCFVAVYNFLAFRLEAPPFLLAPAATSLIFVTYLAGTVTSRLAGRWLPAIGAARTILLGLVVMLLGIATMTVEHLLVTISGLIIFTGGLFLAHAAAVATTGTAAEPEHRGQAGALYNIHFYLGSALGSWLLGLVFERFGWFAMSGAIAVVIVTVAAVVTPAAIRGPRPLRPERTPEG